MKFFFQDAYYYFVLYSLIILILCLLRAHDSNGFLFCRYQFPRILPTTPILLKQQRNTCISCSNGSDYSEDETSSSSSSYAAIQECASQVVVGRAVIDHSAANEYVRSHYNQTRYFGGGDNSKDDKVFECIYNARELQARYKNEKAMLDDNGIALLKLSPLPTTKQQRQQQQQQQYKDDESMKFPDLEDIKKSYLPELDKIIYSLFPSEKILMHCFWNPMIRGESYEISQRGSDDDEDDGDGDDNNIPTANIAPMSHIDTDVGAYESIHDLLNIISKNKVERSTLETTTTTTTTTEYYDNNNSMNMKDIADAIIDGKKRFVILNFWRNMGTTPVVRSPLSILSTRYYNNNTAFPDANPDMDESKWYIFPNTTQDEVIAFYQYDRVISQPSDLWHCAVSIVQKQRSSDDDDDDDDGINMENDDLLLPPRTSFDIRAFIVLDENVPVELDRFTPNRSRPILSFEESGCFCDEQAAKKKINKSTDK